MKAEIFGIDRTRSESAPYEFFNHTAEAILHYIGLDKPRSTDYQSIPNSPRDCSESSPCNCPFGQFHPSYYIRCIGVDTLRLVQATPSSEIPDETPDVTHFLNLAGFAGHAKPKSSINDRLPELPLATHYDKSLNL